MFTVFCRESVPGCLLGALDGASSGDLNAVKYWRDRGQDVIRNRLQGDQLVTTTALHPILTQLRQLGELGVLVEKGGEAMVEKLLSRDEKRVGSFGWLEPVLSQRQVLAANCNHLKPMKEKLALHASRAARLAQQHWICEQQLRQLDPSLDVRWEKVLVVWSQGQRSSAVSLSKKLLQELETAVDSDSKKLLPQVCFASTKVEFTSIHLLGDATAGQMVGSSEDRNQQKYLGKVLGQVFLDLISYSDQDENKTN